MPVETPKLYDVWAEELPLPVSQSKLYYLEPIGIGTALVESLTSYISRLANAHSVLVRTLVIDEILPNLNRTHLYQEGKPVYDHLTTFWKRSAMLNGNCSTASNWVQTMKQLTQRGDLGYLTMVTFANVLSQRGLIRRKQAWCPKCFEKWRKTGQVIYQPLIWQLSVIHHCPEHQTRLDQICPYQDCRRHLPQLASRFQCGFCTFCNRWLGNSFQTEDYHPMRKNEQEWQSWLELAVGDLLALAPVLAALLQREVFASIISIHANETLNGNYSEFARQLGFHRRTVWEWAQGSQVPQLDALLKVSSYFGLTPTQLLTKNLQEFTQSKENIQQEGPTREQSVRHFRKFATERLRNALEQVLHSTVYPPPSMREVSLCLNYDQSHLCKHFPELCQAISARYLASQQEQRLRRLQRTSDQVQQAVQTLNEHKFSTSERQVGNLIGKRGIFKEDETRTMLRCLR